MIESRFLYYIGDTMLNLFRNMNIAAAEEASIIQPNETVWGGLRRVMDLACIPFWSVWTCGLSHWRFYGMDLYVAFAGYGIHWAITVHTFQVCAFLYIH